LGCFDGGFKSAKCFPSFRYSRCITNRITKCLLRSLHAGKTRPRAARGGRGRPPENFGGWKPPRMGALPPILVVCPRAPCLRFFPASAYFFLGFFCALWTTCLEAAPT